MLFYLAALIRPRRVAASIGGPQQIAYSRHGRADLLGCPLTEPIPPFDCAAVSGGTPLSLHGLQPRIMQISVNHDRNRIPSKPSMPLQQRRWRRGALGEQFHVYLPAMKAELRRCYEGITACRVTAGCDGYYMRSDHSLQWNQNSNQRAHRDGSGISGSRGDRFLSPTEQDVGDSLAPKRRKEMDRRYHQRFEATMGLSEDEGSRRDGLN